MNKVYIGGTLSGSFETICGLGQGDSLSTLLFNFTWEKIIRNITVNRKGSIFNTTKQYGAHTDEVIIGRSMLVINEVLQEMEELANDIGLKMNVDKTKYKNTSKHKHKDLQPKTNNINY